MLCLGGLRARLSGCTVLRFQAAHLHNTEYGSAFNGSPVMENEGYCSVSNISLHWERVGKGPNIVLGLPGLVGSYKDSFQPVFKKMDQKQFTLIGWDPPGYGKSRPPNREMLDTKVDMLRQDAHLAAKLMEKLGYKRYSLVGHSGGGRTAALMGSFFPDRIQKIVMSNAPHYTDERCWKAAQMFQDLENWSLAQRRRLKRSYELPYLTKMLEDYEKYIYREFKTQADAKIFDEDLKKITAPTLIIYGGEDPVIIPQHAQNFNKAIWNSKTHEVKNGAHDHLEFLDEFVSVTSRFLLES